MIFGGDDGDFLMVARLIWLKRSGMVQHFCLRPTKEITVEMRPRFNCAETYALVVLKNLRDVFCGRKISAKLMLRQMPKVRPVKVESSSQEIEAVWSSRYFA